MRMDTCVHAFTSSPRTAACGVIALVFAGSYPLSPARAACVSGAQCEANGFLDTPSPANDSFQSIGTDVGNAALKALNGGTITGSALTISATPAKHFGAHIESNGQISLSGSTTITGDYGVSVAGGNFTMTDGQIIAGRNAIQIDGSSTVTLTDVALNTSNNVSGHSVDFFGTSSNSVFTMTGGSITSVGETGLELRGNNNQATLSGVTVHQTNSYALWVDSSNVDNTLVLNGGTTITIMQTGTGGQPALSVRRGLVSVNNAQIQTTNALGVHMRGDVGGLARVDAQDFSIDATGDHRYGMQLDQYSDAKLSSSSISTSGLEAHGILLSNTDSVLTANDLTITTSGNMAYAIVASRGVATLSDSHFVVTGAGSIGVSADGGNLGASPVIHMTGGSINASGTGAAALRGGDTNLNGVTVNTTGIDSIGMYVGNNSSGSFKSGTIHSQGHGLAVLGNGVLAVENSAITSTGTGRYGLTVQSQAAAIIGQGSSITATGANSVGLELVGTTANTFITLDDSAVAATGSNALAVRARGGDNRLDATNSVLSGTLKYPSGMVDVISHPVFCIIRVLSYVNDT